jgi:hypothetical protein
MGADAAYNAISRWRIARSADNAVQPARAASALAAPQTREKVLEKQETFILRKYSLDQEIK